MKNDYTYLYNNLIKLTTNKKLYKELTLSQDQFTDRLLILLFHLAFFFKNFKNLNNKFILQNIYDFIFKQIELSIREIGYGDQSINKNMKNYLNCFHAILSNIHFWDGKNQCKKNECLSKFLKNFKNIEFLVAYFEDFNSNLKKYDLNSYLKSVNKS